MAIPLIQMILAFAQFAPSIGKIFSDKKTENIFNIIGEIAKNTTRSKTEEEALEKLRHDKNLALEFERMILKNETDLEIAILKDKESARNRDIEILHNGRKNSRANIMVMSAAFGLIVCLITIILYQKNLPGEVVGIISTIAGIFGSCLKDAYNFEFGSSRGSRVKDETVASIIDKMS